MPVKCQSTSNLPACGGPVYWNARGWKSKCQDRAHIIIIHPLYVLTETKWPPFRRRHVPMQFLEWKYVDFGEGFTEVFFRTGDKPLSKPMMVNSPSRRIYGSQLSLRDWATYILTLLLIRIVSFIFYIYPQNIMYLVLGFHSISCSNRRASSNQSDSMSQRSLIEEYYCGILSWNLGIRLK